MRVCAPRERPRRRDAIDVAVPRRYQSTQDKKKKRKRRVAKRKGPRTLLGRLRADARAQMTVDALLLRERSILQAEAGFLTVELRKLKRRRKLERAAARRAAGTKVKDAIDSDERAIVKALEDERKAAKAASVYEVGPQTTGSARGQGGRDAGDEKCGVQARRACSEGRLTTTRRASIGVGGGGRSSRRSPTSRSMRKRRRRRRTP